MSQNFLLFMLSRISRTDAICYKGLRKNRVYKAVQTNIPATLDVLDQLQDRNEKLDKILMICTKEVMEEIRLDSMTTLEYYKQAISQALNLAGYTSEEIQGIFHPLALGERALQDRSAVELLQDQIAVLLPKQGNLYLDYTGGTRNAAMVLIFLARLLEKRGMTVQDVIYSNILSNPNLKENGLDGQIESCLEIYECFHWLDSVSQLALGKTEEFRRVAQERRDQNITASVEKFDRTMQKADAGQYAGIKEDELQEEHIAGKSVRDQVALTAMNEKKRKMSAGSIIERLVNDRKIDDACRYVREGGVQELEHKGIIQFNAYWSKPKLEKRRLNAFFSYAAYYESYLKCMEEFLNMLDTETPSVPDAFESFYKSREMCKTDNASAFKSNESIEREFERYCKKFIAQAEKCQKDLRWAMASYYNSGFPFGLLYGNKSYMAFGKLWLPKIFAQQARRSVRDLKKDRTKTTLTELFPPAEVPTFFTPSLPDPELGHLLSLMHHIRLGRNQFIHDSDADVDKLEIIRDQLLEFDTLLSKYE